MSSGVPRRAIGVMSIIICFCELGHGVQEQRRSASVSVAPTAARSRGSGGAHSQASRRVMCDKRRFRRPVGDETRVDHVTTSRSRCSRPRRRPAPPCAGRRALTQVEGGPDVEMEGRLEVPETHVEGAARGRAAGVVHEGVDAAELLASSRSTRRSSSATWLTSVGSARDLRAGLPDLSAAAASSLSGVARRHDDARAGLRQSRSALPRPMPALAPVTIASLPCNLNRSRIMGSLLAVQSSRRDAGVTSLAASMSSIQMRRRRARAGRRSSRSRRSVRPWVPRRVPRVRSRPRTARARGPSSDMRDSSARRRREPTPRTRAGRRGRRIHRAACAHIPPGATMPWPGAKGNAGAGARSGAARRPDATSAGGNRRRWVGTEIPCRYHDPHAGSGRRAETVRPAAPVLVVEDDPDQREAIVLALESERVHGRDGRDRRRGPGGARCRSKALHDPPRSHDACPRWTASSSGARQLKSPSLAHIPVVVVSAFRSADARQYLQVADYLRKPLELGQLLTVVERVTQHGA